MTLFSRCKQGHHDHARDVELLPQEHALLVQHIDSECEDTLVALLAFPV
ncbi:MAG TPA: hypothetical protein V6D05_10765 [Stenomitos sp.]